MRDVTADREVADRRQQALLSLTPRLAVALVFAAGALVLAPVAKAQTAGERTLFERADANGDGRVTAAEARALRDARVARIDTNGDGLISRAEAEAAAQARAAHRARIDFARRDLDGDGFLDAAEREAGAARRFTRLDIDGDGAVTRSEAREALGAIARARR
ncbi:MAG: calcium-binding protein [Pseudomonadota bacterium]